MSAGFKSNLLERLRELSLYIRSGSYRKTMAYRKYRSKLPLAEKTVLFESYHGSRISCSPYAIFKAMLADPEFADFTYVWVLNQRDKNNRVYAKYKNLRNVEFHVRDSRGYLKHLATAKYVVNNKTFHHYFVRRAGQIHVTTWHGTTLKTLGKHQYGRMGQYHNVTRNYLQADYFVMPNRFTADVLLDSCDVRPLYQGLVVDAGQPRSDLTVNTDTAEMKAYLADLLGVDPRKKIVLYAPTWRGEVGDPKDITDVILANITELAAGLPDGHELLLKVHDRTYAFTQKNPALRELANVPDWFETNELLAGIDILITDYSSIFFDFLVLRRPIIHFVFDRSEYERTRGMYFDMETEMAGPLCYTADEVNAAIADIDRVQARYRERHESLLERFGYNEDGHASERVVDIVFRGKQLEYTYRVEDTDRTRVLAYAGMLGPEKEPLLRALSSLDFGKVDLSLLMTGTPKKRDEYYLTKLHPDIKVFYRTSTAARRLADRLMRIAVAAGEDSKYLSAEAAAAAREEFFGTVPFDVAVDFSGEVSAWQQIMALTPFDKKVVYMPAPFDASVGNVASPEFLGRYFDVLACATPEALEYYSARLDSPAVAKLALCPVPQRLEDFIESLHDDLSHLLAGIDYCADCSAKSLDAFCETSDLLFEFRVGGLAPAEMGDYPEMSEALSALSSALEAEFEQSPAEYAAAKRSFGKLVSGLSAVGSGEPVVSARSEPLAATDVAR